MKDFVVRNELDDIYLVHPGGADSESFKYEPYLFSFETI